MNKASDIARRVRDLRQSHHARDIRHDEVLAIRRGDYDSVAPGLFPDEFSKPLVSNLIDTAARDMSEVMAPLPSFNCASVKMHSEADKKRAQKRTRIAQAYVQSSRLEQQMFSAADRFNTFGFFALIVEPRMSTKMPYIRVSNTDKAYYLNDQWGQTREYVEVGKARVDRLKMLYPDVNLSLDDTLEVDVARWYDDDDIVVVLVDYEIRLAHAENRLSRCPVTVVERPKITDETSGQFDDVVWVQIARAMVQMYTMEALEQSVHAPVAVPRDVDSVDIGPLEGLQSDNPGEIGRVPLNIPPGLFPEQAMLEQQQRVGSRYPEGRSGNIDASIITGQGVEALMGTFNTQIRTFQRLTAAALEDVIALCFELDEALWPNLRKDTRVKDTGIPYEITYVPSEDINGSHDCDVSYGAIAGLDPNRALVFILQAQAGGLLSRDTARRELPVELNAFEEEKKIEVEAIRESVVASLATLPQLLPQMVAAGQDPREVVVQLTEALTERKKGTSIEEVMKKVFAPKQQAQQGQPGQPGQPPQGGGLESPQSPGQGLLMTLAGLTNGGSPNLQSTVSRRQPAA